MARTAEELIGQLIAHKTGELASLMTHLGLRLGLFEAMRGQGAVGVDDLAETVGLHRRWVLEWLRQQTASGVTEYVDEESFRLSDEVAGLLLDDHAAAYVGWLFHGRPMGGERIDRLVEAFETGIGMSWDDHGDEGAHMVEISTGAEHKRLPTEILPMLPDVAEKLRAGGTAIDVGCGSGVAICEMATAFPEATFVGIDPSPTAIARAKARAEAAGLENVELSVAAAEEFDGSHMFDLVMVLDCMHDMTHPQEAAKAIRGIVADDGAWLVKDVRCQDTLRENLHHPMGALLYGISIGFCMSSSMSKPDGAGLGTLGFSANTARAMTEAAGFTRFRELDYDGDPLNAFYEVRP